MDLNTIVKLTSNQVSCELEDEAVILNLTSGVYYGLDPVGAVIWKLIEQPRTVASVRDAVLEKFEVDAERCEKDLFVLLEKMSQEGLIDISAAVAWFAVLTTPARILVLHALLLLVWARVAVWFLPLPKLRRAKPVAAHCGATPSQVSWAVRAVSRVVPRATCLVRAIAAQRLLARHGHKSGIYIGVAKPADQKFAAHAWVECEGVVVLGSSQTRYFRLMNWSAA